MEKQTISQKNYDIFLKEIVRHKDSERITHDQMVEILKTYEVIEPISFIRILLTIGSILIGIGILSFIASNWIFIGKTTKLFLIIASYLGANITSFFIENKYPKTSRSLIYLGVLIFGSGIYLIGQMLNFGGHFTNAFMLWSIGIIPLTLLLKDKWSYAFLHILLLVYLNGHYFNNDFPIILIALIPLLYVGQLLIKSNINLFLSNIIALNFIWYLLDVTINLDKFFILLIFFIIGLMLYYIPIPYNRSLFQSQGNLIFGIAGLILTIKPVWYYFSFIKDSIIPIHIIFALLYVLFLTLLIRQENLYALIFIGLTILRFYFDAMYDFLPKLAFFIIGGLILLVFGYYFERKRRNIGREENE